MKKSINIIDKLNKKGFKITIDSINPEMSSSITPIHNYVESVNSSLVTNVLNPLSEWLSTNPKDTSVQSMMSILQIPIPTRPLASSTSASATPSSFSSMNIPNFLRQTGVISPLGDKKKQNVKAIAPAKPKKDDMTSDSSSAPCIYIFQRGKFPGRNCGRPSVNGTPYCKSCIKKKSVENQLTKTTSGTSQNLNPNSTTAPPLGVKVVPNSMVTNNPPRASEEQPELNVEEIPDRHGFFLEQTHNFIVHQLNDGTILAVKVKDGNIERKLTQKEKEIANSMALATIESKDEDDETDTEEDDENDFTGNNVDSVETEDDSQDKIRIPKIPSLPSISSLSTSSRM